MIRRGFWLVTGAALGITGYRKATKLTRTLTGQLVAGPEPGSAGRNAGLASPSAGGEPAALPAGAGKPSTAAWPVRLAVGVRAAAGFMHDVRAGMADYHDLHGGQLGRSLGSQAGQIAPGRAPRGMREP